MQEVIEILGKRTGPSSVIFAGVHGNEVCGVELFNKILPQIEIDAGRVVFVYANPRAIEANVRFTEANLNRMFKPDNMLSDKERGSYEYARAQFLKPYLHQADALLDIHASTVKDSRPFVICEPISHSIVQYLPFDTVISGFDTLEPGGTDYYMNSLGKPGICIECGYFRDPKSTQAAELGAIAFLKALGHLPNDLEPQAQTHMKMYQAYLTKTDKFTLCREFANFEVLPANTEIGTDGNELLSTERESFILFAHDRDIIGAEAFLLGETTSRSVRPEPISRRSIRAAVGTCTPKN